MRDELARLVNPIFRTALDLQQEWRVGGGMPFDAGYELMMEKFRQLHRVLPAVRSAEKSSSSAMQDLLGGSESDAVDETYLGVAYPLACWVDELFIVRSPLAARWNDRKFEVLFHASNDRAWRFWQQARLAANRPDADDLEVFFLCASLGFRGEWIDDPQPLAGWLASTRDRLLTGLRRDWTAPPALDPPASVPPLRGVSRLRRMATIVGLTMVLALPIAAWLIVRQVAR